MLEERGIIIAIDQQFTSVRIQRKNSCGHCSASNDCGTASFSKLFGQKYTDVKVPNTPSVKIGDQVIVGFQENALLKGALVLYLLPLMGLLMGSGCYEMLAHQNMVPNEELLAVLSGLLGFISGLWGARLFNNKTAHDVRYQPVLLRTDP